MALIVQKFGGTSVGSIERIEAVADRIIHTVQQGHQVIVVVSAMAGETNRLLNLATEIDSVVSSRELDVLVTAGEQVSSALLAMALIARGYPAISMLADQIGIYTDSQFGKARITKVNARALLEHLQHGRIVIAAGFQGRDSENNVTSLGRGGTDTTAVAIAAAVGAVECQIYTDVEGVYTTDPRIVPDAKLLRQVTFEEMLELASLGAKVLQKRSVEMAGKHNVKVRVLSSFLPLNATSAKGTLITYEEPSVESPVVSGIACTKDEALIHLIGLKANLSACSDILNCIAQDNIEVDMIVQSVNHGTKTEFIDLAFTVSKLDFEQVTQLITDLATKNKNISFNTMQASKSVAKISIVGVGMRSHAGVASKVLKTLADELIPVELITTSEIKISVLVDQKYMDLGVRALHQAFQLNI